MKDYQEGEPQPGEDESKTKSSGTVHYLDEWRARHPRYYSTKSDTRRKKRRGTGPNPAGRRGIGGRGVNPYGYGYSGGYGGYGGYYGGRYSSGGRADAPSGNPYGRGRNVIDRSGTWSSGQLPRTARDARVSNFRGRGIEATGRRRRAAIRWLMVLAAGALVVLLLRAIPSREPGPMVDPPPVLKIWVADGREHEQDLARLLNDFSEAHDVNVQWRTSNVDTYELIHTVLVGPAPDVILVDGETGARLLAMDALLELFVTDSDEEALASLSRDGYLMQLAEETMWVRSLRAAIPRQADNPHLARRFIAYLAGAASEPVTGNF